MAFDYNEVKEAYARIKDFVRKTPLEQSFYLGDGEREYFFKLESFQKVKSFKIYLLQCSNPGAWLVSNMSPG